MKRYKKIVTEAKKDRIFGVSEETSGELTIKASLRQINKISSTKSEVSIRPPSKLPSEYGTELSSVIAGEYAMELSVYTDEDGNRAVVPPGWVISGIRKENIIWGKNKGLVIYQIPKEKVSTINWSDSDELEKLKRTYDQFVWTPVSLLKANGTLDGVSFTEKFGRRNYLNDVFSDTGFHEELVGDLKLEKESSDKYDGYYSSRYDISKDPETKRPRSVKGADPWVDINEPTSEMVAKALVEGETVNTHLMYGAEYDTREEWVIETKTKSFKNFAKDSTKWGNYWNTKNSPRKVAKTGSTEKWCANNIYDLTGNVDEWTQEQYKDRWHTSRGGNCETTGYDCPAVYRFFLDSRYYTSRKTGFRATLYIK